MSSARVAVRPISRSLAQHLTTKPVSLPNLAQKSAQLGQRQITTSAVMRSAEGGSHVTLWTAERALSLALLGVIPIAFLNSNQITDGLFAISIVIHQHWGLEAIVTDYIRPIIFGNTVPKLAHLLLALVSAATLGGLLYFNYNDVGISTAIKKLWAVKGKQ